MTRSADSPGNGEARIVLSAAGDGAPRLLPGSGAPMLLSTGAPWSDLVKLEHHRIRGDDQTEYLTRDHVIALRLAPPRLKGRQGAGRREHCGTTDAGDLFVLGQGTAFRLWHQQEAEALILALAPGFVEAVAKRTATHWHRIELLDRRRMQDPVVRHLLLALRAELELGCPAGRLYGEALATALAPHLLRHHAVAPLRTGVHRSGLPPARLRRVLDHIEAQLGNGAGMEALAGVAGLSPHHFSALFKASTGLSPHRYLLQHRVARAQELLAGTQRPLAEIGLELGFGSQSHFTTAFRRLVGATPGAWRAERRR